MTFIIDPIDLEDCRGLIGNMQFDSGLSSIGMGNVGRGNFDAIVSAQGVNPIETGLYIVPVTKSIHSRMLIGCGRYLPPAGSNLGLVT